MKWQEKNTNTTTTKGVVIPETDLELNVLTSLISTLYKTPTGYEDPTWSALRQCWICAPIVNVNSLLSGVHTKEEEIIKLELVTEENGVGPEIREIVYTDQDIDRLHAKTRHE